MGTNALKALDPEQANSTVDLSEPIQVADRTWWVGHHLPGDPFQCHVFLIENGDQSVLLDPGSALTFAQTLRKIERILPLSNIRYYVCHHQDPDITGAMPLIDRLRVRDDAVIVTHWRAEALIRHFDLGMPFWRIEDNGWVLDLEDRRLRFVFTPYLHFAGAFCTFDEKTGTLFSSDLFGGFIEGERLYAKDESYFEAMRPFHEHYMPSRDILAYGISKLAELPVQQIAPQHGLIIPGELVRPAMSFLQHLDCGLYLLARKDSDLERLIRLNTVLKGITRTMMQYRDFAVIAASLLDLAREFLPINSLEFYVRDEACGVVLRMSPDIRYRGCQDAGPAIVGETLGVDRKTWAERTTASYIDIADCPNACAPTSESHPALLVPLFDAERQVASALAILRLDQAEFDEDAAEQIVEQMALPLQIAVERETVFRQLDRDREDAYERSIRDPLTGLYTRAYMDDAVRRMCEVHDRKEMAAVGIVMIDIDHFKSVNDRFGHRIGDAVLKRVAGELISDIRKADIAVRMGGEEFAVFCPALSIDRLLIIAERLRRRMQGLQFDAPTADLQVTISLGVTIRQPHEPLDSALDRADQAMYRAKQSGRNRLVASDEGADQVYPDATPEVDPTMRPGMEATTRNRICRPEPTERQEPLLLNPAERHGKYRLKAGGPQ